jgi:hypothetical protein
MKIGYPNHPRKPPLEEMEWIGRSRFDFLDLFLEEDQAAPEKVDIERTRKLLRKYRYRWPYCLLPANRLSCEGLAGNRRQRSTAML